MKRISVSRLSGLAILGLLGLPGLLGLSGCGGAGESEDPKERALERSRAVAGAEWSYGQDTIPPEQGEREARLVERCRVTLPDAAAETGRTLDVTCGHVFLGLEPDADSVWIEQLVGGLGVEVVERGRVPAWTTSLGEPVTYLLVRTEPGREATVLARALASDKVRFVDVREISRRRP